MSSGVALENCATSSTAKSEVPRTVIPARVTNTGHRHLTTPLLCDTNHLPIAEGRNPPSLLARCHIDDVQEGLGSEGEKELVPFCI